MSKIFFASLVLLSSCSSRLLFPIEHGVTSRSPHNTPQSRPMIYIEPRNSLSVRSVEDCEILAIMRTDDSSEIVVTKGQFDVGYGNLKESYVTKGQHIKRGQIIGKLFDKEAPIPDNYLSIYLQKNGVAFQPNW